MKAFWEKFTAWRGASLARRIVVSVAGFSLLTCVAIGAMSLVAVSIARAVLPSSEAALAQGSTSAEPGSAEPRPAEPRSAALGKSTSRTDAAKRGPRAAKSKAQTSDTPKDEEEE